MRRGHGGIWTDSSESGWRSRRFLSFKLALFWAAYSLGRKSSLIQNFEPKLINLQVKRFCQFIQTSFQVRLFTEQAEDGLLISHDLPDNSLSFSFSFQVRIPCYLQDLLFLFSFLAKCQGWVPFVSFADKLFFVKVSQLIKNLTNLCASIECQVEQSIIY